MLADKIRWEERYKSSKMPTQPSSILVEFLPKLPKGRVLDIACGNGRNLHLLAENGFFCEGIDISQTALQGLHHQNIRTHCLDLDSYALKQNYYSVILNFYFLDRAILAQIPLALQKGGMMLLETFIEDETLQNSISPHKILKQGEMEANFEGFRILHNVQKTIPHKNGQDAKILTFVAQKC
ncbi:class I SAM-dependent methyltransferase [Helicobacter mustelae]|uniref:Putative telleurite resistance protein TehB n=1 Tax=Helicobacter mustelae (strain ATCC 43772 / CCUG 25715 / CIP 103759 / LMG 18044 / NCTC 12198 / R85-136P) TaxID=679897 RepID=D3UJG3_HELM1|nr:class I SAM-dependent methyltransferase [Helicobacter mustelae]CBG40639.1 putative telleurite resistance protein TehB [Helicobacter mustelae 12198]SQH72137.1 telleurite resistance protein TehB [Helicobacter mustelae]